MVYKNSLELTDPVPELCMHNDSESVAKALHKTNMGKAAACAEIVAEVLKATGCLRVTILTDLTAAK